MAAKIKKKNAIDKLNQRHFVSGVVPFLFYISYLFKVAAIEAMRSINFYMSYCFINFLTTSPLSVVALIKYTPLVNAETSIFVLLAVILFSITKLPTTS